MKQRINRFLSPPLVVVFALIDIVAWAIALTGAALVRHGFDLSKLNGDSVATLIALAAGLQIAFGLVSGLYVGRRRPASFEETGAMALGAVLITLTLMVVVAFTPGRHLAPLSAILGAAAYQLVLSLGTRYIWRWIGEFRRVSHHPRAHRALIFGAGEAGEQAARALREDPESDFLPLAFLDDDPALSRLEIVNLPVVGGRHDIESAARRFDADSLIVAMPSARRSQINAVAAAAQQAGLKVWILPRLAKYLTEQVEFADLREFTLSEFLHREEIKTDLDSIAGYLRGHKVLVTGAGGSIGSVLCKLVAQFEPSELVLLDRDEGALHALQLSLHGRALMNESNLVLADIRDRQAIRDIFAHYRPDVVFHTAALKHLALLEEYPVEAVKTNILGTRNVLEAAIASGARRIVNISTDKAVEPVSVLGATKRIAELLTAAYARVSDAVVMSVRFGNVLGSRGSIIPTLREQLATGRPLTITHPDVTRFFMTVEEAVELVVQAGAIGEDGEVLVLDMGEPVRIVDLARQLAAEMRPGEQIEFEVIGLRAGEKLHESATSASERLLRTPHPLISAYEAPPLEISDVDMLGTVQDTEELRSLLWGLVGSTAYEPMMMPERTAR